MIVSIARIRTVDLPHRLNRDFSWETRTATAHGSEDGRHFTAKNNDVALRPEPQNSTSPVKMGLSPPHMLVNDYSRIF